MKVKEQVLLILETNKGKYVSGEDIAKELYVSRNAVWKAINALRKDGFIIDAVTNKGYMLGKEADGFTALRVSSMLNKTCQDCEIIFYDTITSTNTVLKEMAEKGAKEGTILIADTQTEGRGRRGRSFFSPAGTGIYMSILLRPGFTTDKASLITVLAAVSVVRAIKETTDLPVKIKWVNDIMLNDTKICGILTEAAADIENGHLQYAVVGIGINISMPEGGFPYYINDIASVLFNDEVVINDVRCSVSARVINNFFELYHNLNEARLIKEYKDNSCILGKEVRVFTGDESYIATALDIDENAHLIVKDKNDRILTLTSSEVSIRKGDLN